MEKKESVGLRIDACHRQAADLLRGARLLVGQEGLHHLAFHFGVLALEEIGKAGLLLSSFRVGQLKEEPDWVERHAADHVKKLFWAMWGPSSEKDLLTKEYLEGFQNAARATHDLRLRALYVDVGPGDFAPPAEAVEPKHVEALLGFADASLNLSKSYSLEEGSAESTELFKWFLEASEDPEKRQALFGRKSLEKRAELGDVWAWMTWVRSLYTEAEASAKQLMENERVRVVPTDRQSYRPKWKLTIRLHTTTHSIRPKPLAAINKRSEYVKLISVNNHKDQLLVEFILPDAIRMDRLWDVGFATSRRFIAALNIASLGHFWWYLAAHATHFYEHLRDLASNQEVEMRRTSPALEASSHKRVLDERQLLNAHLFYTAMPDPDDANGSRIYHEYLAGLTFVGKQDVHLQSDPVSFRHFFDALSTALVYYGDATDPADVDRAFHAAFEEIIGDAAERAIYCGLGRKALAGQLQANEVKFEQVLNLKTLCDVYLHRRLSAKAKERFNTMAAARALETPTANEVGADSDRTPV